MMKRNWMTVLALTSVLTAGPVCAEELLPTNVTALQVELLKQQIEVVRATREKREMEAEVIRVRDELRVMTERATRGTAQSQSLAKQLTDARRYREEAEKAQTAAEVSVKEAREHVHKLEGTVRKLEADLRKACKDLAAQTENVQRQETALAVEKSVSETAVKRANELKQNLVAAQKRQADAQKALEEARQRQTGTVQALADAQKQLADAQRQRDDSAHRLTDVQKQLADTRKDLSEAREELKKQAEKLTAGTSAQDAAVKALAEADKEKTALEDRIKVLEAAATQQGADAAARLDEQKKAYTDLADKFDAERQALQTAQSEIVQLKARLAEMEKPAAEPAPAEAPKAEAQPAAGPAPEEAPKAEASPSRPTPPAQSDLASLLDAIPPPPPIVPTPAGAGSVQITPAK